MLEYKSSRLALLTLQRVVNGTNLCCRDRPRPRRSSDPYTYRSVWGKSQTCEVDGIAKDVLSAPIRLLTKVRLIPRQLVDQLGMENCIGVLTELLRAGGCILTKVMEYRKSGRHLQINRLTFSSGCRVGIPLSSRSPGDARSELRLENRHSSQPSLPLCWRSAGSQRPSIASWSSASYSPSSNLLMADEKPDPGRCSGSDKAEFATPHAPHSVSQGRRRCLFRAA